jgi:hypothetical protein
MRYAPCNLITGGRGSRGSCAASGTPHVRCTTRVTGKYHLSEDSDTGRNCTKHGCFASIMTAVEEAAKDADTRCSSQRCQGAASTFCQQLHRLFGAHVATWRVSLTDAQSCIHTPSNAGVIDCPSFHLHTTEFTKVRVTRPLRREGWDPAVQGSLLKQPSIHIADICRMHSMPPSSIARPPDELTKLSPCRLPAWTTVHSECRRAPKAQLVSMAAVLSQLAAVLASLLLVLLLSPQARGIYDFGPITPYYVGPLPDPNGPLPAKADAVAQWGATIANGFPAWYRDDSGRVCEPCTAYDPEGVNGRCLSTYVSASLQQSRTLLAGYKRCKRHLCHCNAVLRGGDQTCRAAAHASGSSATP